MALEQEFLAEFSAIASFPEKELAQRWDNLESKLVRIQRDINAASGSVEALGLGGESPLFPAQAGGHHFQRGRHLDRGRPRSLQVAR